MLRNTCACARIQIMSTWLVVIAICLDFECTVLVICSNFVRNKIAIIDDHKQ